FKAFRFDFHGIKFRFDAIRLCFDRLSINFDRLSIWRCAMSRRETMATINLTASADLTVGKGGDGTTFARCFHVCVRKSGIRRSVKKDE
ncbi:MAG: hypothetical protein Q4E49_07635, partial [Bacteroidales bacterium]|nr:hypothetical protein [Bacteroidales bacterium]